MREKLKISKGTLIRTVILVLAIANNALALWGKSPLPIDDAMVEEVVSFLFTTAAALVAWWKNNSFTQAALIGDAAMERARD